MKNLYRVTLVVDIPAENEDEAMNLAKGVYEGTGIAQSTGEASATISPEDAEYKLWMQELEGITPEKPAVLTIGRGQHLFALMAAISTMGGVASEERTLGLHRVDDDCPRIVLSQERPDSPVNRTVIPPKLFRSKR